MKNLRAGAKIALCITLVFGLYSATFASPAYPSVSLVEAEEFAINPRNHLAWLGSPGLVAGQGGTIYFDWDQSQTVDGWHFSLSRIGGDDMTYVSRGEAGPPPETLEWDGAADGGGYLAEGEWLGEFQVDYEASNTTTTGQRFFIDDRQPGHHPIPPFQFRTDQLLHGVGGAIFIGFPITKDNAYKDTIISLTNTQSGLTRTWSYLGVLSHGDLPTPLVWDGYVESETGAAVVAPVGEYVLEVELGVSQNRGLVPVQFSRTVMIEPVAEDDEGDPEPVPEDDVLGEEDELTPEEIAEQARIAKLHPVLLIHGLNAYPDMWRDAANNSDYVSLLKSWGYPEEYIATYSYTGTGAGIDGYNNQGSIAEVSLGMREAVLKLRQVSLSNGGDGEVDIVAHSMGGLVAREYLRTQPTDYYISKVIAIGTPFQGSWLMSASNNTNAFERAVSIFLANKGLQIYNQEIRVNNPAEEDMIPGSKALALLSNVNRSKVKYYTLYGNIKARFTEHLFNLKLESNTHEFGDLIVLPGSATLVSRNQPSTQFAFINHQTYYIHVVLERLDSIYSKVSLVLNGQSLPYYHSNLTRQAEIQSRVIKVLKNE